VVPIVEGYGDVSAVPTLLARVHAHLGGDSYLIPLDPIRQPRDLLIRRPRELERAVKLAKLRLDARRDLPGNKLILLLVDADEAPACQLGPELLRSAQQSAPGSDVACVLAVPEYETWFVAAADSLTEFVDLAKGPASSTDPEQARHGKRWLQQRFRGKYSETIDQRRLTSALDVGMARARSSSFDKLCREIEVRIRTS
jgi:hypothetical protein